MANISSQSTRSSGRTQNYAKKDAVAISAVNASVPMFEQRLAEIRAAHGKDGFLPKAALGDVGKPRRDENGAYVVETDAKGRTVYEARYVQAYSLVQSFGHDELDPDDPDSWTRANALGRALAEDRFPGHPVLIATEISGRSGCVHNHLVVGATHPETGRQIDSNVVTHSRLALAHDRVLAEHGFEQREDMKRMALAAGEQMKERRAEVMSAAPESITRSELNRRLLAAENSVRFDSKQELSPGQRREAKRLREFDRYKLNEQDRAVALDIGVTPPKEKFSEIELEGRIKDTLNDPRATSWESLAEIGRENRVTIEPRGERDVTYGMMLAQPEGTIAEPARAHRRRGGVEGAKAPGLGDGFRRTDIEAAIAHNVELQREAQAPVRSVTDEVLDVDMSFLDEYRINSEQTAEPTEKQIRDRRQREEFAERVQAQINEEIAEVEAKQVEEVSELEHPQREVDEQAHEVPDPSVAPAEVEPTVVETEAPAVTESQVVETVEAPAFRSKLRDATSKSVSMQERLTKLSVFEERWHGRLPSTPEERAEFEQQVAAIGVGPKVLDRVEGVIDPQLHARLTQRVEQAQHRAEAVERHKELTQTRENLEAAGDEFNVYGTKDKLREVKKDLYFEADYIKRVDTERKQGVYASREHERHERRKQKAIDRGQAVEDPDVEVDAPETESTYDRIAAAQGRSRSRDIGPGY